MKKLFYLALISAVMVACGQSQEQKAEALIKESLKKSLYKPETYKPVETKVDSAFAPYDDPALFEELKSKAKRAKTTMSIYSGPYMSAFDRNQYQEAKKDYNEANEKIEKLKTKGRKQLEKVIKILQGSSKFVGYKAIHNYRADNNADNTLIGNTIFFIDKNFEEITYSMEVEEYDQVQEAIDQLQEQLEETEE